jgi:hypothetical protein
VKPQLYYRAGDEVEAAIKSAKVVWAKAGDEEEDDEGGTTPTPGGGGTTPGGGTEYNEGD